MQQPSPSVMVPEVTFTHTFLPRCKGCGSMHPLAHKPPVESENCLNCGGPVDPPGTTQVQHLTWFGGGLFGWLARMLIVVGRKLNELAGRL